MFDDEDKGNILEIADLFFAEMYEDANERLESDFPDESVRASAKQIALNIADKLFEYKKELASKYFSDFPKLWWF